MPTAQLVEELELGNVYWTPEELDHMSNRTFVRVLEILGNVPNFSIDQLKVLLKKATEVQLSHQICKNRPGKLHFLTFLTFPIHTTFKTF